MLEEIPNQLPALRPLDVLRHHVVERRTVTKKQIADWTNSCDSTVQNWIADPPRTGGPSPEQVQAIGANPLCPLSLRLELAGVLLHGWGLSVAPVKIPECDEPPLELGLKANRRHAGFLCRFARFFSDRFLSKFEAADLLAFLRWLRCYADRMELKIHRQLARQESRTA